jgi:hypothetical protein
MKLTTQPHPVLRIRMCSLLYLHTLHVPSWSSQWHIYFSQLKKHSACLLTPVGECCLFVQLLFIVSVVKVKVKLSFTDLDSPLGLPDNSACEDGKVVSPVHWMIFPPQEIFL